MHFRKTRDYSQAVYQLAAFCFARTRRKGSNSPAHMPHSQRSSHRDLQHTIAENKYISTRKLSAASTSCSAGHALEEYFVPRCHPIPSHSVIRMQCNASHRCSSHGSLRGITAAIHSTSTAIICRQTKQLYRPVDHATCGAPYELRPSSAVPAVLASWS